MAAGFLLASYGRDPRQARDALIFTVVNLLGSAMFLIGVVALYHLTGTLEMRQIAERIVAVNPSSVILNAALIFAAFSVKLGLFPFHFWLPAVYSGARPAVAAILSGALANIGSYGLLRFGAGMLPQELALGEAALLSIGAASVIYGSLVAIYRRSPTETLAYSSISQAGYILIGLSIGGRAGYAAAVVYALLNGLNKALLFLAVELRGRLAGAAFAIGAFSVAGLPPAAGFFGKAALFKAGIAGGSLTLVTLIFVGGALSFVYMFQTYQREFWTAQAGSAVSPLGPRVVAFTLAVLLIALGLWPEPLLALGEQAAFALRGG
jgi:multicomponent Na+:H+ antiporter subunit D